MIQENPRYRWQAVTHSNIWYLTVRKRPGTRPRPAWSRLRAGPWAYHAGVLRTPGGSSCWQEVEGRLPWRDDRPGYDVMVDGRRLTWEKFGDTWEPFDGCTFRLSVRGTRLPSSRRYAARFG